MLVTHADEPIGRRTVKTLYHDPRVGVIFAVGDGPPPRSFDKFLSAAEPRVVYARVDLARHRPVADLFHSSGFRAAEIDTVVHLPRHGAPASEHAPIVAGIAGEDNIFVSPSVRVFKTGIFIIREIDKEGMVIIGVEGIVKVSKPIL